MPTTLHLDELYRPIADPLRQVVGGVADLWGDAQKLVHGESIQRPKMGGKMLRPALCLLSAGAIGAEDVAKFVPMATAMELLHLAALAHDDVIDGSDLRRGVRSLNKQWDNHTAVLGGDYLVARSIAILGVYDSCSVIINAIDSVRQMAEGELIWFGHGPGYFTQDGCISLAKQKTASLFAVACSTPTCLLGHTYRDDLHQYGVGLGIAFQLVDDILDLSQNRETLGKPACGDVAEGKKTAPLLFLREALDSEGIERLDRMTGRPVSDEDREWIGVMIETTGARERAEALAREYADEARAAIEVLPASAYRDAMSSIIDFVLSRGS